MAGTQFSVARLQRGLQLIKEENDDGRWVAVPGVTYERNLTCFWDAYTDARAEAAARFLEEQRSQHSTLACWTYDLCNPIRIEGIDISADRRTVWVKPASTWDAVKANMEAEIRRHGMGVCVYPAASPSAPVPPPRPSPSPTVTPPPPIDTGFTRIHVSALQLVAIRDGKYRAADYDCLWGRKSREAARGMIADLTGTAIYPEGEQVYQGGQVVDLYPSRDWGKIAEYIATEITTVDYKPCPLPGGGDGAAPEEETQAPLEVTQAGAGGGLLLLALAAGGVGYWFFRRK